MDNTPRTTSRTQVYIDGALMSAGLATTYDGVTTGHVSVYADGSSLTINSGHPEPLRQLAAALIDAADEIEKTIQVVA